MSNKSPRKIAEYIKEQTKNLAQGAKLSWDKSTKLTKIFTAVTLVAVVGTAGEALHHNYVVVPANEAHTKALLAQREDAVKALKARQAAEEQAKAAHAHNSKQIDVTPRPAWPVTDSNTVSSNPVELGWGAAIAAGQQGAVEKAWTSSAAKGPVQKQPEAAPAANEYSMPVPTQTQQFDGKPLEVTTYENFINAVNNDKILYPELIGSKANGRDSVTGQQVWTQVYNQSDFQARTLGKNVQTPLIPDQGRMTVISNADGGSSGGGTMGIIESTLIMAAILIPLSLLASHFYQKRQNGGSGGAMKFGKSKARRIDPKDAQVRFSDVAGVDAVKSRLMEMVDLLQNPDRPGSLGGKHPTGFLMSGPPGTGKTLLAKAVAGEAGVPFFSVSGSEFVEMFVGTGAARVRDLFKDARELGKPCVIFIDEIDAVGGNREAGQSGGGKEHEQTLNQLLTELDGFEGRKGIVVIAATNRPEMLDPALVRSGRFNKSITVPLPDMRARIEVIQLYFKKLSERAGRNVFASKESADQLALELAQGTPGMSPADIEGLVNEAALEGERRQADFITWEHISEARDTHWMGDADRNKIMTSEEKEATAWHEAGHAMVAILNPQCDPPEKLTVLPRGGALGMLVRVPTKDRTSLTYEKLLGDIEVAYAGREAEIMQYGISGTSTGASQDFRQATGLATQMIMDWGMPLNPDEDPDIWLGARHHGRDQGSILSRSEESNAQIDSQITDILKECQKNAREKVRANKDKLQLIVDALLKYETLKGSHIKHIVDGENIDDIMAKEQSSWGIEMNDIAVANNGKPESANVPVRSMAVAHQKLVM
jgi:cell division protease FtsH